MEIKEAVNVMKKYTDISMSKTVIEAHNMAIEALEKQIPKKVNDVFKSFDVVYGDCPCCGEIYRLEPLEDEEKPRLPNYCSDCGQKLDWSDENAV